MNKHKRTQSLLYGSAKGGGGMNIPEKPAVERAREVVVDQLKVDHFIESHQEEIYKQLEENARRTREEGCEGKLMFMAESLPLISGIVHVGSSLENLTNATEWVRRLLPKADPVSILSALTFIYIVEKGAQEFAASQDAEKRNLLVRIGREVEGLLEEGQLYT